MPNRRRRKRNRWKKKAGNKAPTGNQSGTSNSSAQEELARNKEKQPVIPQAPVLDLAKQSDPLRSKEAARYLDWSEGRGNPNFPAHARSAHSGKDDTSLDARGKAVATSFLSNYDQDKAFAASMAKQGQASGAYNKAKSHGSGIANTRIWNKQSDKLGGKGRGDAPTPSLARVAERQSDGTYDHFNAKVTETFAKFSHDGPGKARVQTLYPSDYERLPAPDNPAQMPDHVTLDDITDTDKLRHVETVEKDLSARGRVVEPSEEKDEEPSEVVDAKESEKKPQNKPKRRRRRRRRRRGNKR